MRTIIEALRTSDKADMLKYENALAKAIKHSITKLDVMFQLREILSSNRDKKIIDREIDKLLSTELKKC